MINKDYYRYPGYNIPADARITIIEITAEHFAFMSDLSEIINDQLKLTLVWGELINQIFGVIHPNKEVFLKEIECLPNAQNQPYIEELITTNWISNFELIVKNLAISIYNRLAAMVCLKWVLIFHICC